MNQCIFGCASVCPPPPYSSLTILICLFFLYPLTLHSYPSTFLHLSLPYSLITFAHSLCAKELGLLLCDAMRKRRELDDNDNSNRSTNRAHQHAAKKPMKKKKKKSTLFWSRQTHRTNQPSHTNFHPCHHPRSEPTLAPLVALDDCFRQVQYENTHVYLYKYVYFGTIFLLIHEF